SRPGEPPSQLSSPQRSCAPSMDDPLSRSSADPGPPISFPVEHPTAATKTKIGTGRFGARDDLDGPTACICYLASSALMWGRKERDAKYVPRDPDTIGRVRAANSLVEVRSLRARGVLGGTFMFQGGAIGVPNRSFGLRRPQTHGCVLPSPSEAQSD